MEQPDISALLAQGADVLALAARAQARDPSLGEVLSALGFKTLGARKRAEAALVEHARLESCASTPVELETTGTGDKDSAPSEMAAAAAAAAADRAAASEKDGPGKKLPSSPAQQLLAAARDGHISVVERLLAEHRSDSGTLLAGTQATPSFLDLPLAAAASGGHPRIVKVLLNAGADINARSKSSGLTALTVATYWGQVECLEALLLAGADRRVRANHGKSALRLARQNYSSEKTTYCQIIRLLKVAPLAPGEGPEAADEDEPLYGGTRTPEPALEEISGMPEDLVAWCEDELRSRGLIPSATPPTSSIPGDETEDAAAYSPATDRPGRRLLQRGAAMEARKTTRQRMAPLHFLHALPLDSCGASDVEGYLTMHLGTAPAIGARSGGAKGYNWSEFAVEFVARRRAAVSARVAPEDHAAIARGERDEGAIETGKPFTRTFAEATLGLRLAEDGRGGIVVKEAVEGTPAAQRCIPIGCYVTTVNDTSLANMSAKEVQRMLARAERPVTLHFEPSKEMRQAAAARAEAADRATPLEKAETFSRQFTAARLGLILSEDQGSIPGKILTRIKATVPRSPARQAGVPPGSTIVAVNGKSVEWRKTYKEVKKLIELAQRPVTINFSAAEEVVFPNGNADPARGQVPGYVLRPV